MFLKKRCDSLRVPYVAGQIASLKEWEPTIIFFWNAMLSQ